MSGRGTGIAGPAWLAAVGTAGRTLVQLRWTAPLLLVGSMLALILWQPIRVMGDVGQSGLVLWLHLPCFFWTAAVLAAGLDSWPTFGRGQTGADHVLRLRIGPLQGCGAASLAVLAVLCAGLAVLGSGFSFATGLGPAHEHLVVPPERADRTLLNARQPSMTLRPPTEPVVELRLRPLAFAPAQGALRPTAIEVRSGGKPLHDGLLSVEGSGELLRVVFPARRLADLEVRVVGEVGVPLRLDEGRVVALSASTWPSAANSAIACLTYAVPAAVALALVCCAGPFLGLPVASMLALATLLLTAVAGWVPTGDAVHSLMLGRRVLDGSLWSSTLPSLSVALLALLSAMWTRRRSTA